MKEKTKDGETNTCRREAGEKRKNETKVEREFIIWNQY